MTDIKREVLRLTFICAGVVLLSGCDRKIANKQPETSSAARGESAAVDHLAKARRMLLLRDYDAATEAAYKALVQNPDNGDATLVAGEAEAARGNHQVAADLAREIDVKSRLGKRAVDLHYQQLVKLGQPSAAADVIIAALDATADVPEWRHAAWELLNRVGRREEASRQAEMLCRAGLASEQELHSLIRRTRSFPFHLNEDEKPEQYFDAGLGMARWHFTQGEFDKALDELSSQSNHGFDSAAACALYGRLLAETQAFEQLPTWHAKTDQHVQALGDYWAALGTYFYDQRQFEASARAYQEAVYRNPTDRVTLQRLSKVFGSLERPQDGQIYRQRGINVANTERFSDALLEADDRAMRMSLAKELANLGRPFETLQWTASLAAESSLERTKIDRQRAAYRESDKATVMAAESSLIGIPIDEYKLGGAMELLEAAEVPDVKSKTVAAEILARPRLPNVASQVGIEFQWYRDLEFDLGIIPIHESVGGGIAVLDYDLDGWPDVYLAQGSGDPPTDKCTRSNVLFRNRSGKFTDTTEDAGTADYNYGSGLSAGDINQDGFPDLLLGSLGRNRLLVNNGDGTFREVTERLGEFEDRFTSSLAIADINGDALPDLFESNYIAMDGGFAVPAIDEDGKPVLPGPLSHVSGQDRWFENKGDGTFRAHDIPADSILPGTSLGLVVTDFDDNGSNEVFVGNDVRANHLLVSAGENGFHNLADSKGIANGYRGIPNGCMGISAADFNRDGLLDLHITNFNNESANLYIQTANGLYTDSAIRYGIDRISDPMVGFGTKSIDVDRNGWLDLIVTNGHIFDTRIYGKEKYFEMPPQMLMSNGRGFELTEVDDHSGYWEDIYLGRAMASLDFDRSGSIDFLIGHLHKPLALLDNQTETEGSWIQIELVGTVAERDAIGARVVVVTGSEQLTHWVTAGDGYFCSDEAVLDFGLGIGRDVDRVEIFWPSGGKQIFEGLKTGHRYLIIEGEPEAVER